MLPINSCILLASVLLATSAEGWTNLNCPAPRSPTNGMSFIFDNGQRVQFHCHPGFKMIGKSLAECKRNRWDVTPPRCIPVNASSSDSELKVAYDITCVEKHPPGQNFMWAPPINGGHVKGYYRAKNSSYPFNYYVFAVYDCKPGYTLVNAKNSRMYCQRRRWVEEMPRCVRIASRRQPCHFHNGGCHHICVFAEEKVHCSCRPGFELAADGKSCETKISWKLISDVQGDDSRERKDPCGVNNGGCNQICRANEDRAVCQCLRGFRLSDDGRNCIDIDECLNNNGGCEKTCVNFVGSHVCRCPQGYKVAADRRHCQDENECSRNNGHGPCSDKCENTKGSYRCSCTIPGTVLGANNHSCDDIDECKEDNFGCSHICYNSYGNAFCSCPEGYQLGDDYKTCMDYDECEIPEFANKCKGRCINEIGSYRCEDTQELKEPTTPSPAVCSPGFYIDDNGRCEDIDECQNRTVHRCHHQCVNTPGSFHCICPNGYSLREDGVCLDIDECQNRTVHRCRHQCVNTQGSFHCICPDGYSLREDGDCVGIDDCKGCSHGCKVVAGTIHCTCPAGYRLDANETNCEDIDECKDNSLGCSHGCKNLPGTARCTCPVGYRLDKNKKDCIDIDECESAEAPRCHHKCINTAGSYHCACSPGYILSKNGLCQGCERDSYHSEEDSRCINCPKFSHTQKIGMTSRSDCICEDGFVGNLTTDDSCTDIDECKFNNGECTHSCINTLGSFHCACPLGYHLDEDEKTCVDTDECLLNKGGCHQGCVNMPGSFRCTCSEGYVVTENNHFTCTDIDECSKDNGGCSHTCVNHNGGYYCTCKNGYRLSSDFRSCVEISCKMLPEPHNGKIKCSATSEDGNVPMDTSCQITCKEGYKATGSRKLTCGIDGDWSEPFPSCVSLTCPALEKPVHGDIHPLGCLTGSMKVFEKCYFTCDAGYRLVGRASAKCTKDLKWRPAKMPKCESNVLEPFIQCPGDVTVTLEPHKNRHYVRLNEPKSNMDRKHIEVYPKWVEGLEANFPAGVTEIHFIAKHPSENLTASCRVRVIVEDKEPPSVSGCPGDIVVYADSLEPVQANWIEPVFEDNVGIESVGKSQKPGARFNAGSHMIHYTAVDTSNNVAKCVFTVNVLRKECGEPRDFLHGEKNCMDSLTARFCEPICDPGYAFFGNVSEFYMCGSDGIWFPSEDIPDCSPFVAEPEEGCMPGTEFREEIDTDSRICVACLQGMYWDVETSSCVSCPVGTYQDEYGQTTCKPCTEAQVSDPLCEKST